MGSIEQLRELAERLGKATGPYRELDDIIWDELDSCRSGCPISYTSFVDAALALVERLLPGWEWVVGTNVKDGERVFTALLHEKFGAVNDYPAEATTPSLAILRALVAALIAQAESA